MKWSFGLLLLTASAPPPAKKEYRSEVELSTGKGILKPRPWCSASCIRSCAIPSFIWRHATGPGSLLLVDSEPKMQKECTVHGLLRPSSRRRVEICTTSREESLRRSMSGWTGYRNAAALCRRAAVAPASTLLADSRMVHVQQLPSVDSCLSALIASPLQRIHMQLAMILWRSPDQLAILDAGL